MKRAYIYEMENEVTTHKNKQAAIWRQVSMVIIVSTGFLMNGCVIGWITPALPKLISGEEGIKITPDEESLLTIYPEFGHFIVPIPIGILADRVGRKPVFIITSTLSIIGWGLIVFSGNFTHIALARIIQGFTYGIQCTIGNIYISEISSEHLRGRFNCAAFFFNNVGILLEFVVGGCFSMRSSSVAGLVISIILFVQTCFIVESPYYLLNRNQKIKAKSIFEWFRGATQDSVKDEFDEIVKHVHKQETFLQSLRSLVSKSNYKGFVLCIMVSFLADMTGRGPVLTYAKEIFLSDDKKSSNFFMILLGVAMVFVGVIPTLLSDRIGRKKIIVVTALIGCGMQLATGFLYFLDLERGFKIPYYSWLLFFTITGYLSSWSIFLANTLTLRGELIRESSRGLSSGFVSMAYAISILISIRMFQLIRSGFGLYYAFWTLSFLSLVFALFTKLFIPETKNRTLEEIQRNLANGATNEEDKTEM